MNLSVLKNGKFKTLNFQKSRDVHFLKSQKELVKCQENNKMRRHGKLQKPSWCPVQTVDAPLLLTDFQSINEHASQKVERPLEIMRKDLKILVQASLQQWFS